MGVGRRPEGGGAAAENFRLRFELGVYFQPDDRLEFHIAFSLFMPSGCQCDRVNRPERNIMKQAAHTVKTFCIEDAPLVRHRHMDRWRAVIPR